MRNPLCTHCGAKLVPMEQVMGMPKPMSTGGYSPIGHGQLVEIAMTTAERLLVPVGYTFSSGQFAITNDGNRMFGVLTYGAPEQPVNSLLPVEVTNNLGLCIGLRNSYDKSMSAGIVIGGQVFVCDNLAFNGELVQLRRHTGDVEEWLKRDVRGMMFDAVDRFTGLASVLGSFHAMDMTTRTGIGAMWEMGLLEMLPKKVMEAAMAEWRTPRHPEFQGRNLFSMYNCLTEATKMMPATHMVGAVARIHQNMSYIAMGRDLVDYRKPEVPDPLLITTNNANEGGLAPTV